MNENGHGSNSVVGLSQPSRMHVPFIEHHECPHCPSLFTTVQELGSHLRTHMEINLQQVAIQEGRSAVVALPVSTTAPKFITDQEVLTHTQTFQSKEIHEAGKQQEVAIDDRNIVLPLRFVPRVTNGGLDWSWEGLNYTAPSSNLLLEKIDSNIARTKKHESEAHCPHLVDFMNIPEHGGELISSADERTNSELIELRQAEQGQEVPTVNTNLTLNPEGIDLTLRL